MERAILALRGHGETLHVAVQNFVEFWAVATRPEKNENGLGMSIDRAARELDGLKGLFQLLPEPGSIFEEWERLVPRCRVSGQNTHDARLAATMRLHGIEKILTFNTVTSSGSPASSYSTRHSSEPRLLRLFRHFDAAS